MNHPNQLHFERSLVWLRRDLRLQDNRALYEACKVSKDVFVVFVFDSLILAKLQNKKDQRVTFIHGAIEAIDLKMQELGAKLIVRHGDPAQEIPQLAESLKVQAVFANEDYEPYAKSRDKKVELALQKTNKKWHSLKDHVIFAGAEVCKDNLEPYRVFTPYKNRWYQKLTVKDLTNYTPQIEHLGNRDFLTDPDLQKSKSLSEMGFEKDLQVELLDEHKANKKLHDYLKIVDDYATDRDFPALDKTSHLSTCLRFGLLSTRACVRAIHPSKSLGRTTWLNELIWRDFYHMILDQYPHVVTHSFLPQYNHIQWPGSQVHFKAWCEGRTGYPLVDAAMRQLNQTGWMHNRLRMVTASFLVKDLLIDWKQGESYFAEKLLDFDLAANNGGWQWCASTGCDAQPYFRIFNPIEQSKKFDPAGKFIKHFVPELRALNEKTIHFPQLAKPSDLPLQFTLGKTYPLPIVDHKTQRAKALNLYSVPTCF